MNCDAVWELLSVYADGETSTHETEVVEGHISVCTDCARDLEFMRSTSAVLQETPEIEPPMALRQSILAATVYRPTLPERLAAAVRKTFAPAPARYGALAAAGAAAALTFVAFHNGEMAVNPAEYAPKSGVTAAHPPIEAEPRSIISDVDLIPASAQRPVRRVARVDRTRAQSGRPSASDRRTITIARDDRPAPSLRSRLPVVEDNSDPAHPGDPEISGADATAPTMTASAPEMPAPAAPAPAIPASINRSGRIVLAASSSGMDAGQAASLADLRRTLNRKATDGTGLSSFGLDRDRQIRVDVIKGSF